MPTACLLLAGLLLASHTPHLTHAPRDPFALTLDQLNQELPPVAAPVVPLNQVSLPWATEVTWVEARQDDSSVSSCHSLPNGRCEILIEIVGAEPRCEIMPDDGHLLLRCSYQPEVK